MKHPEDAWQFVEAHFQPATPADCDQELLRPRIVGIAIKSKISPTKTLRDLDIRTILIDCLHPEG